MKTAKALVQVFQNFGNEEMVAILTENSDGSLTLADLVEKKRVHDTVVGIKGYDAQGVFVRNHRVVILYNL